MFSQGGQQEMELLITIFLCGDIMTGRGIDQVLPSPGPPILFESFVRDARIYVEIAEKKNGPISRPVTPEYVWGDALAVLDSVDPDVRVINLETSVTSSDDYWKGKGINYRMNPANIRCLTAAHVDVCSVANNHVLDWGYFGLAETLKTLRDVRIKPVGAGANKAESESPAIVEVKGKGRVIVFGLGTRSSGIPLQWASAKARPGVYLLPDLSGRSVRSIASSVNAVKQSDDIVIASIHWGRNWGYSVPAEQQEFARGLIDEAGVDIVHGHSSHHVKAIEVYHQKLILYGCGDFLNDYEGISGHERFRNDLSLMYFPTIKTSTGELVRLQLIPMKICRFRLNRASRSDALWLRDILTREGRQFGTRVELKQDGSLELIWLK